MIINAHNFSVSYPSLHDAVAGYYARLDSGAAADDRWTADGTQNGTLTNGATRADDGSGLAYSVDGVNDYITGTSPTLGASKTISCWAKSSSDSALQNLLSVGNSGSTRNYMLIRLRGDVSGDPCEAAWENSAGSAFVATGGTYSTSAFVHVCATVSTTNGLRLYVNGSLVTTTAISGSVTGINVFSIGALRRSTVVHFASGLIDDAIIFTRELTATEVGYLASQRGAAYL